MSASNETNTVDAKNFVRRIRAVDYQALGAKADFENKLLKRSGTTPGYILLFDENFDPIAPLNRFLQAYCRIDKSISTQNAYANDLAAWWTHLRVNKIQWDKVDLAQIDGYTAELAQTVSSKTRMMLSEPTLIRRVCAIEAFYVWAFSEELLGRRPAIGALPQDEGDVALPGFNAGGHDRYKRRGPNRPKIPKRPEPDAHVKPLTEKEMVSVIRELGPSPYEPWNAEKASVRNRLIAEVGVETGMRIDEVCGLTTHQLDEFAIRADPYTPRARVPIRLTRTKNRKVRMVAVTYPLWQALVDYRKGERKAAVDMAKANATAGGHPFTDDFTLFVNGLKANKRDIGRPVSTDTVSRAFARAVMRCGQTKRVIVFLLDPTTGTPKPDAKTVAGHTFHHLRHTFAVNLYRSEMEAKRPAPLKKLQGLLGHSQMRTTEDIYLKYCEVNLTPVEDALAARVRGRPHADD